MYFNTPQARELMDDVAFDVPARLYKGAGKAWAAVKDGEVVGLVYMNAFPCGHAGLASLPSATGKPRVRMTDRAMRMLRDIENESFRKHREASRAELAQMGDVVSGSCSCTKFYPKSADLAARAVNLAVSGDARGVRV